MNLSIRTVDGLYRFPVKGLSPERLDEVALQPGYGFPLDRSYALTDGTWQFDPQVPVPMPKTRFLMLAKHERLARLQTRLDPVTHRLEVAAEGGQAVFELREAAGRLAASRYFAAYLAGEIQGTPQVVHAEGHQFTDVSVRSTALMHSISLINLASVRALASAIGQPVDPLRFRGNLLFDGGSAWEEFGWLDREIRVGGIRMRVVRRTKRCAATAVDPQSGERDLDVPAALHRLLGHFDLGVYAEVMDAGSLRVGDTIDFADPIKQGLLDRPLEQRDAEDQKAANPG